MANPRFDAALQRMRATHEAKSHDYATPENPYANFDFASEVAARFASPMDQVFATMVGIKLARLGELTRGKTPKHESLDDSFLDLANYVVLWWTQRQRLADAPVQAGDVGVAPPDDSVTTYTAWVPCGPRCTLTAVAQDPPLVVCHCTPGPRLGVVADLTDEDLDPQYYGHGV